jgi:hypothetical protein
VSQLSNLFEEFDTKSSEGPLNFESKYKKWYTSPAYLHPGEEEGGSGLADSKTPSGGGSGYGNFAITKRGFHLPPMEVSERAGGGSVSSVQQILVGKGGGRGQKQQEAPDTASRVEMWMQQRNKDKDKKNVIMETHNVHQGNLVSFLTTPLVLCCVMLLLISMPLI